MGLFNWLKELEEKQFVHRKEFIEKEIERCGSIEKYQLHLLLSIDEKLNNLNLNSRK